MAKKKRESRRRTVRREENSSQLLERGEGPTAEEQSPNVDDSGSRPGGPARDPGESSAGASGADEGEGLGFTGENTWGEEQHQEQSRVEQGRQRPTDESLASDLREILGHDPELDATDIGVEVEGGLVTLSGTVHSSDEKLLAEELVESVSGVRQVHNQLAVAR